MDRERDRDKGWRLTQLLVDENWPINSKHTRDPCVSTTRNPCRGLWTLIHDMGILVGRQMPIIRFWTISLAFPLKYAHNSSISRSVVQRRTNEINEIGHVFLWRSIGWAPESCPSSREIMRVAMHPRANSWLLVSICFNDLYFYPR